MKFFLRYGQFITLALIILLAIVGFREAGLLDRIKKDSDVEILKSEIDYDNDGIDDYTDILNGAKEFVATKPKYKSKYYAGGYPTDGYFVCTDVIWYALKNAGYDLKDMMDKDILENKSDYDIATPDANIDFRRVRNIKVFLDKYTLVLTTDTEKISEFQPGDIIVYQNHIAILSDKRNIDDLPFIIHHDGFHKYEEDGLTRKEIIGHYRFKLNEEYRQNL